MTRLERLMRAVERAHWRVVKAALKRQTRAKKRRRTISQPVDNKRRKGIESGDALC